MMLSSISRSISPVWPGASRVFVAEFQGYVAFPIGLKRCGVDDVAAAGVGGFAQAEGE